MLGRSVSSLLRSRFLRCHATLPRKNPIYIPLPKLANRSFGFIFKDLLAPNLKFAFWDLSNQRLFFNFASRHGKCQKSTVWKAFKGEGRGETRSAKCNWREREVTACKHINVFSFDPLLNMQNPESCEMSGRQMVQLSRIVPLCHRSLSGSLISCFSCLLAARKWQNKKKIGIL